MIERNFSVISQEAKGQAEMILKNTGLTFLKPAFFRLDVSTISKEQSSIQLAVQDSNETISDSRSKFGLPVFDTILFEQLDYKTNDDKDIRVKPFSIGTALCDVSMSRNIVVTQIAGRNGTVKEYISDGDFQINIKGVLASLYQNTPPTESIGHLLQFCSSPVEIDVTSNFLAYFGIYTLVIKDYKFNQMEGQRNVIGFDLTCLSDVPFEIKGTQNKSVPSFI